MPVTQDNGLKKCSGIQFLLGEFCKVNKMTAKLYQVVMRFLCSFCKRYKTPPVSSSTIQLLPA